MLPAGSPISSLPITGLPEPPGAPTVLSATGQANAIALSWVASPTAISYSVYRSLIPGAETLLKSGIATASFTDTGIFAGITYYYTVTATNEWGESAFSNEASAIPSQGGPPFSGLWFDPVERKKRKRMTPPTPVDNPPEWWEDDELLTVIT